MEYNINEIFTSIQGEGIHTGLPTTFVRFSGCNLRCRWCDTTYALDPKSGNPITLNDLLSTILKTRAGFVCLTGGEPLLQPSLDLLITNLIDSGLSVDIETNGSIDLSTLVLDHPDVMISMDVKPPSSGESDSLHISNLSHLREKDQIKFIIADEVDLNHSFKILRKYRPVSNIIFTPCSSGNADFIADRLTRSLNDEHISDIIRRSRLMVQTHKIIWDPDQTGV